ncbi:hypothetical protein ATCC90586_002931 [Pythium insidiosum]|nr:hypothetical protein ATCC90586_002931 [Pythium insidiosum]
MTKDEFRGVVPSPVTPSRRSGASKELSSLSTSQRRPSDGPAAHRSPAVLSPRAKAHMKDSSESSEASKSSSTSSSVLNSAGNAVALPHRKSISEDDVSKTFLTALAASKHLARDGKHRGDQLRPPSPLEAADAESLSGEPGVMNYVGVQALDKFWSMFHREDAVMNHTQLAPSPSTPVPAKSDTTRTQTVTPSSGKTSLAAVLSVSADRPRSARTTYLAAIRKLRLSPEPMGIVRRRALEKGLSSTSSASVSSSTSCSTGCSTQEINLSSYCMGDGYAAAFSESFGLVPGVEALNLAANRISDDVAARLISNALYTPMGTTLQVLNLSHNALGTRTASAVASLLTSGRTVLTTLNLAHNHLRDRDIVLLCDALQKNQTLLRLHLSENRFGITGMVAIGKFLEENAKIEEMYLAWNNLRGLGALKIVESLRFHASLRALDLSWNSLDSNELLRPRAIVSALADALANNKVLVHLDLSNNHLDVEDCAVLAKQLELNQTLIGLHLSGNCGVMDTKGFIIPKRTGTKLLDQHKTYSIAVFEEAMSEAGNGALPNHLIPLIDRYCWYCAQWSEYRFTWHPTRRDAPFAGRSAAQEDFTPVSSHGDNLDPVMLPTDVVVKIHLSVDDWQGVEMERRDDGSFSSYHVLPPGKIEYFFSVSEQQDPSSLTRHYAAEKRHSRLFPHYTAIPVGLSPADVFGSLTHVNYVRVARREGRDPCNSLTPRSRGRTNDRAARWDINRSVFARRRRESMQRSFVDTDGFLAKACAADWRQCKIDRFVKDPVRRRDVELCVTRHFRTIAGVYRRYCGHNVLTSLGIGGITPSVAMQLQNDLIAVPWSGYVEFLSDARIMDESSEFCRLADLENVFVAANLELTQEAKEKDNPDRSLTRFEFLEVVIRIAINKYHRSCVVFLLFVRATNVCDTPAKAVDKLVVDDLTPICPEDPNEFRARYLYTEEISDVFSEHVVLMQDLYNSNMGRYCKPGEKKGMQLAEFLTIMDRYQVYNDQFRLRDIKDPFLACKLVVLDEMATVGHKKLFLTDFMELLLRVAVLRYPPRSPLTVTEVAKSLQTLFQQHFLKHEGEDEDAIREDSDENDAEDGEEQDEEVDDNGD